MKATEIKNKFIEQHPEFEEQIQDFYQLYLDEIEEGGSPSNELYLFEDSCKQLWE
jgi:ABC-type Zn uptake system ZnuABC Zn-binding protein ZnuA